MKRSWISALIVSSLALSACADDEDDTASENLGGSPSAASPTPTPTLTGVGLDPAFGTAGVLKAALSDDTKDRFGDLQFGPDGKLYAAGLVVDGSDQKIAVARFGVDGKPDAAFGEDGVASVNVSPNAKTEPAAQLEQARSVVVQKDGRVIAVGTAEHEGDATGDAAKDTDIVAVAFDSDGKPDAGFGEDGIARIDLGTGRAVAPETFVGADQAYGSAALEDGGVAIFGATSAGADREDADLALVVLGEDGELNADFAEEGVLKVDVDGGGDSARHVQLVDDKLIATGYTRGADGVVQPVMIRASLDGELDDSFGEGGIAKHKVLGNVAESYQFGLQGDKYVLTGYGKDAAADKVDLIAYRFNADGSWDDSFGDGGVTKIDNVGQDDRGRNLVVLPDDRIVYVGSGKTDEVNQQAMVVVLTKDGKLDPSFGYGGKLLTDLGTPGDTWYGVALDEDGETVYLAGYTNVASEITDRDDAYLGRIVLK